MPVFKNCDNQTESDYEKDLACKLENPIQNQNAIPKRINARSVLIKAIIGAILALLSGITIALAPRFLGFVDAYILILIPAPFILSAIILGISTITSCKTAKINFTKKYTLALILGIFATSLGFLSAILHTYYLFVLLLYI